MFNLSKKKVYLSSTFVDLVFHRGAVKNALEPAGFELEQMEKYAAFDERPTSKCLADVEECDYYVLILGRRYGFVPAEGAPDRSSITKLEYRQARKKRKPCFVFLLSDTAKLPAAFVDADYNASTSLISIFRSEVSGAHGVSYFESPSDLAQKVLQALSAHSSSRQRRIKKTLYTVLASVIVLICSAYSLYTPQEPNVTAADWLRTISVSQERRLGEYGRGKTTDSTIRRDVGYLAKMSGDPGAWDRFRDAYEIAALILSRRSAVRTPRLDLRNSLARGEIESIISWLNEMPVKTLAQTAERNYVIGAFQEVDGQLSSAYGSYEKAASQDQTTTKYSLAALDLATNIGLHRDMLAFAGVQLQTARRSGVDSDTVAKLLGYQGLAFWFTGESAKSYASFEEALKIANSLEIKARLFNDQVPLFNEKGDSAGAEATLRNAARLYKCSVGSANRDSVSTLLNLSAALIRQGRSAEGRLYLDFAGKQLDSPEYAKNPYPVLRVQHSVVKGLLLIAEGNFASAEITLSTARSQYSQLHLDGSFLAARVKQYIGRTLLYQGKPTAAEALELSVEQNRRIFGADHSETITSKVYLSAAYFEMGRSDLAQVEIRGALKFMEDQPNRVFRFEGKLAMIKSEIEIQNIMNRREASEQYRDAFLALTQACRKLEQSSQVPGEALTCWRKAITLNTKVQYKVNAEFDENLVRAEANFTDLQRVRSDFKGIWDEKCS